MRPGSATINNFSILKAHEAQLRLSQRVITEDRLPKKINHIAGVDVAYSDSLATGAVAVLNYDTLELEEWQTATCKVTFPYVPTLLSFREIPPAVACIT